MHIIIGYFTRQAATGKKGKKQGQRDTDQNTERDRKIYIKQTHRNRKSNRERGRKKVRQ